MVDFDKVNVSWYIIPSAFILTVVYVPVLVHFSLEIPPCLEEEFLQCFI